MSILPCHPPNWKRPSIPLATQVALLKAFIRKVVGTDVNIDHRPPLSERQFNDETRDTIPSANDIAHLEVLTKADHDVRTFGLGAEKRITTAGSDANRRAKVRALSEDQEEFRRRVLERAPGQKREPTGNWAKGRKIQGRGFGRRNT